MAERLAFEISGDRLTNRTSCATVWTLVESELGISLVTRCVRSLNRPVVIRAVTPKSARIPLYVTYITNQPFT